MEENLTASIRDTLVARRAQQFQFVRDLVRTPSPVPPGDQAAVADVAAAGLKALGLAVERHQVPNDVADQAGLSRITNLVVRYVFGAGPVVALAAHGDTPPPAEGWTADPFEAEIKGGVLLGVGAATKADIAVYAHALAALIDARPALAGTVELHVTFDGAADGDLGPKWLLDEGIVNPDCVVAGGTARDIGTSAMGDLQMEVAMEPMPALAVGAAAAAPADPMEAAGGVLAALHRLRATYGAIRSGVPGIGSPTLVIGEIEGGERPDRAPRRLVMRLDRRLIPDEDAAAVEAGLTGVIAEAAARTPGVVCRIRRLKLAPPMKPGPGSERLTAALQARAAEVMGADVGTYGVPYDANSRHYAAVGVPVVLYGAGPQPGAAGGPGGPDERLALDDLRKATEVVALALADYLTPAA